MNAPRSNAGFTLLEMVVAITLLAVLLSALMPALQQGLFGLGLGEERARALALARSLLTAHSQDLGQELPESPGSGVSGDYQWSVSREPYLEDSLGTLDEDLPVRPMRVTATVVWSEGRREVVLSTLSLDPPEEN